MKMHVLLLLAAGMLLFSGSLQARPVATLVGAVQGPVVATTAAMGQAAKSQPKARAARRAKPQAGEGRRGAFASVITGGLAFVFMVLAFIPSVPVAITMLALSIVMTGVSLVSGGISLSRLMKYANDDVVGIIAAVIGLSLGLSALAFWGLAGLALIFALL